MDSKFTTMDEQDRKDWLERWDKNNEKFKWFIVGSFMGVWENLVSLREKEDVTHMIIQLENIWFWLPDSKFNIQVNPKGWSEFLNLLES